MHHVRFFKVVTSLLISMSFLLSNSAQSMNMDVVRQISLTTAISILNNSGWLVMSDAACGWTALGLGGSALGGIIACCECCERGEELGRLRAQVGRLHAHWENEKSGMEEVIPVIKRIGEQREEEIARLKEQLEHRRSLSPERRAEISRLQIDNARMSSELVRRRQESPERRANINRKDAEIDKLKKDYERSQEALFAACAITGNRPKVD